MVKHHFVVVLEQGGIGKYPQKKGWKLHIGSNEVLVIRPDETGTTSYANTLLEHSDDGDAEAPHIIDENQIPGITFALERNLQSALRSNIEQLEPGLSIVDGGRERTTKTGRMDILAEDRNSNLVVIELKAGRAPSDVITQTLSYMNAIAEEEGRPVRGAIVAGEFTDRVISAAKAVPNLDLFTYSYLFSFSPVA